MTKTDDGGFLVNGINPDDMFSVHPIPNKSLASPGAAEELDLKWAAASGFVRDVLFALGRPEPAPEAVVDLPSIALQVVGQIEELKAELAAARPEPEIITITKEEAKALWLALARGWIPHDKNGDIVRKVSRRCYALANDFEKGEWMAPKTNKEETNKEETREATKQEGE